MFVTEVRRVVLAARLAAHGACGGPDEGRLFRVQVCFPDIGGPFVMRLGFLRYQNEKKLFPDADTEEVQLSGVLTNPLSRSKESWLMQIISGA